MWVLFWARHETSDREIQINLTMHHMKALWPDTLWRKPKRKPHLFASLRILIPYSTSDLRDLQWASILTVKNQAEPRTFNPNQYFFHRKNSGLNPNCLKPNPLGIVTWKLKSKKDPGNVRPYTDNLPKRRQGRPHENFDRIRTLQLRGWQLWQQRPLET